MKTYIKNLLLSTKVIIITYILQYIFIISLCLIYKITNHDNIEQFINNQLIIYMILFNIIITIYLYKKNKIQELKINKKNIYSLISIGISISCLLNMIIIFLITPKISNTNINLLLIVSSTLIGPIYEEILFRYILYNRLKKFNSNKLAILITSIIFAIIHIELQKIFFALILGLILNTAYESHKNILVPVIIHISANLIALLLTEFNISILLLSIILFIVNLKVIFNKNT